MVQKNKVMQSINLDGDLVCVDVFQRPDGTFGFDEYRRDPEDGRGWYSIGHHADAVFDDQDTALAAARRAVGWLNRKLSN